ncbi:GNAT family N-acetyltransferase [Paenibacillus guangzhouensis]|uniref:GNAT family N-acetyltransferase n=1 Tax=Paenibacillus guangzhouensis TaxID=1473112 RepID=UPI00187BB0F7|nr:GNAT family N-acetyltransferase [Paenibacillus guangzhouensis]
MTREQPEIRSITNRAELEAVYDVLGDAFPIGRDFFRQRMEHDSTYDLSTTWIAAQGPDIASTVQLFPFIGRVDDAAVNIGGIGSVATVAAYRGQGHCRHMLHDITAWMEEQEYDLSLLFAVINPFYEKAGWSTVPETMYELDLAGVTTGSNDSYEIVPFDPSDTDVVASIYEQFNEHRTGTVIRPSSYWLDRLHWPKWRSTTCLLAKREGVVVAYGHITKPEEDGTVYLDELCYRKGEEGAAIPLFYALAEQRPEAKCMLANLPADHILAEHLLVQGAVKKTLTYMMWKIIRFQLLLAKLVPVFQRRLQHHGALADQPLLIEWECAGQKAYFHALDGQVAVAAVPREGSEYVRISMTQQEFMRLLLHGIDETALDEQHSLVLEALFPKQNTVFYLMDRF